MRLSSANLAAGLVLAGRGVATTAENVAHADSNPGYLAVPVGIIPRTHRIEKRTKNANAIQTTLENMNFFYAAQIGIGTPPQNITLLIDTGSSELWVNPDCQTARPQDAQLCAQFGQYNPRKSRTPPVGPFGKEEIRFGDTTDESTLTSVKLTYFTDKIAFGSLSIENQTFGMVTESKRQSQGILGLAPDLHAGFDGDEPYSLVLNSMAKQGVIASRVFSLDLRHSDTKTGALIYGGLDRSKFVGTLEKVPIIKGLQGETRLAVSLDTLGITMSREENYSLQGNDTNVMLDSGTTISRLQADVAMPILKALRAESEDNGYFYIPCSARNQQGSVDFGFGGTTVRVPFKDFIINVGDPYTCYAGIALTGGQQILGETVLRAGYFVFDWDNEAVHIGQAADCGESDIVKVGTGKDAVPSVTGNCAASQILSATSASTSEPAQTISVDGGAGASAAATTYTVTACPAFDPKCQTEMIKTVTAQATPTESGGEGEDGGSGKGSSNGDKKNSGSGRTISVTLISANASPIAKSHTRALGSTAIMVFQPPSWVPALPDIPDSVPLCEFMYNESYGRYSASKARNPYTCGVTGTSYTSKQVPERVDLLARAIAKRLGFSPNEGTEWDRVVAVYSVNTIDYIPLSHAVHRLSGIVTPANAQYSTAELEHQLVSSGAKAVFTCLPLLETALKASDAAGIPRSAVFLLPVPGGKPHPDFPSVDDLVAQGRSLPAPPALSWIKGQGARQTAFLCYSSGTSGLPKAVMISHFNIISNIIQMTLLQSVGRKQDNVDTENVLGILPLSHIYGLTVVAHVSQYRGDQLVILPKFELPLFLRTIQDYKLNFLPVVPPMLIQLITNQQVVAKYNLDSVRCVFSGAAPLGIETQEAANKMFPKWKIGQGYGMTETSPVATASSEIDLVPGSSGGLLPGYKAKLIDAEGNVVTGHDQRGELLLQSPSVVLGYLHNEKANAETFVHHADGRWIRTGDEAVVRKSPKGNEHIFITDRIKELIKVKGFQVAPAELEAHLLTHDYVHDCTVIPVDDDRAGEVPKAFVVKSPAAISSGQPDAAIRRAVEEHVEKHKTKYKWLKGGVEFIDAIPKSPSGKILRRVLKDKEKAARKAQGAKL